jgi:hypothetical protein
MKKAGQSFADNFEEIDDLTPIFQDILGTLRTAQIKRKRAFYLPRDASADLEGKKYAYALAPRGVALIWYWRFLEVTKPVRKVLATRLNKFARYAYRFAEKLS